MAVMYILYSEKTDQYYVGATNDLAQRLIWHNTDKNKFTSKGAPWRVVYFEEFASKSEAMKREREIKKKKSRKYIEWLIAQNNSFNS
jgi:putative endonuclease